jgi:large repetitive protein
MTRNYFKVKTIDSLSLAGGSPTEGFCVEPNMKGPSFVYFFLILTNCNQMSQFNSIFSPLSNKLARLAGITLLAVAALFAGTQQMSAQTCVQNLSVSLDGDCSVQITPNMVVLGSTNNLIVKINDNTPSDNDLVNTVSPVTGWTYGVFNAVTGNLVCQGTIVVRDDKNPTFSPAQRTAFAAIDTVITWADNVDEIVNVKDSWNKSSYKYFTFKPEMTDSCGGKVQLKVTDYYENGQCATAANPLASFHHVLRRSFQFIDERGNDTTLNQIIYFQRPAPYQVYRDSFINSGYTTSSRFRSLPTPGTDSVGNTFKNAGPGNLAMFGPFGNGPRKAHSSYGEKDNEDLVNSAKKIVEFSYAETLGKDQMLGDYNTTWSGDNVIAYNIDQSSTNGGGTCYDFQDSELEKLLSGIYVAIDSTPNGTKDSISLFSKILNSQYSVDFKYNKYPACNNGKKYEITVTVFDWCTGVIEYNYLVIKMEDNTPPVFAAYNDLTSINAITVETGGIKGLTSNDSVIISVGLNDCTANLRLPATTGTRTDLRDLSALFNLGVYDRCSTGANGTKDRNGNSVTLNYKFQTRDVWNDGFYVDRDTFANVNYTVANLGAGGTPVAMGLPIGEHRIIIEAWDQCSNRAFDTLYFDVQDMVAPTMKCDDQLNVTLTSNSTSNWYVNGRGSKVNQSEREVSADQNARIYVADVNEGSRDNCTLDSMYVRRRVEKSCIETYFKWNMDYDIFGNNDGEVTTADFELVSGTTYYTPKYMQYVEVTCCDGASGTQLMVELWGSDLVQGTLGNSDNNAPKGRNWSFCWGNIQIEDKTRPVINAPVLTKPYNTSNVYKGAPRDVRNWVDCIDKEVIGTPTSNTDGAIADVTASNLLFGYPDVYGIECKGTVDYSVVKSLVCDTGSIVRTWIVTKQIGDNTTIRDTAKQTIYVRANHNFSITVPADIAGTCADSVGTNLILDEVGCDLLAVSYSDTKYDAAPGDNFCYKIYRTATVINWCMVPNHMSCAAADPAAYAVTIPRTGAKVKHTFTLKSENTGRSQSKFEASTGGFQVRVGGKVLSEATTYIVPTLPSCVSKAGFAYKYTQVIKVSDVVKPTVASGTAWTPATAAADVTAGIIWNATKNSFSISGKLATPSCVAKIKLSFAASDVCATNDLELEKIELLDRGLDILTPTGTSVSGTTTGTTDGLFTISASNVPVGTYDLRVTVRDDCGNVTVSRLAVDVEDNKAPAPVCVQNLTATLMPSGGSDPKCMVVVAAVDVFQNIERDWNLEECSTPVKATIAKLTNGVEGARTESLTLTEADKGGVTARVYLTDNAGNADFCTVTINVEDNFCGNGTASAAVAGAIQTESKATVEGVQVNLSGQTQKSFATGVNGLFVFNNLAAGADYTVTPSLNKGFLNGVSTFDLVLISKHILGVQPLNTPYKLIAADVNNSKSVTTLDLIQLRKLILNIDATFANNSSWRFVDATYTFPNASNPWAASFPEVKNVNDLVGSLSANFVAVKVGDVNGNAIANSTQGSVRNLTSNLGINVADMNLVAGNEYKVDFTAADLSGVEGFQFTLNLDKKGLELVDLVPGIAAEENFGIFAEEGVVTASWNGEAKGGVLFSLVVRAKSNTTLSEVLNLNSRYTAAEAYKGGEVMNVGLNFNASKASANYELYQNTPNPFAGESIIGFNLPAAGAATLTIQDVTGRTLKVINGQYAKGYNQVSLKSTELSATGVLTYTLKAADFTATRKMIIVE